MRKKSPALRGAVEVLALAKLNHSGRARNFKRVTLGLRERTGPMSANEVRTVAKENATERLSPAFLRW